MVLNCSSICKTFIADEILHDVSFHIEEGEKAAIVGINGSGKSTLLKIIMKELEADSGTVTIAKDHSIGYLAQHQDISSDKTVYEEVMTVKKEIIELELTLRALEQQMKHAQGAELDKLLNDYTLCDHEFENKNGYAARSEVAGILKGLGFSEEDFGKKISMLSGGEKTRVSLGKLLLSKPDILLLDEPTNHLDLPSIAWLETYIINYRGSVVIVAHDRYFLDKTVSKIIELDNGVCTVYSGTYSDYSAKRASIRAARLKAYYNNQREIKRQQEVIDKLKSFNREKSIKRAESREKMLAKMETVEKPAEDSGGMHFKLEPAVISGNDVLSVKGLTKSFGERTLFRNIDFEIKRGERVALIGANGTGKTTILKIINGLCDADCGTVTLGANVECGYYDQEHQVLDMDKTLFQEISDAYPYLTNTRIRNVLAAFLFTDDDVFKRIGDLSGGERGRVLLARLMLSNSNFLLLDEPTNHLDINSKEILEEALNSYTGTCFFVSHDRYFINSVATRILDLRDGVITGYLGNYDYYLEKSSEQAFSGAGQTSFASAETSKSKEDRLLRKEEQARERKRLNEISGIESRITEIDGLIEEIDGRLSEEEIYTDHNKAAMLSAQREDLLKEQEKLYSRWEELEA